MTKEDLDKARIPVPHLFAYGLDADCHKVGTSASGFSFKSGIPSSYSSLTGKKVCRGDMNGLGRAITQSKWFNQLGGYYTFTPEVSDMINGYPLGAVLYYKEPDTGYIRMVRSLVPDNAYNFVETPEYINNVYWSFVDNVSPVGFRPRIFPVFPGKEPKTLSVNQEITVDVPCLFMIQTGCDSRDSTEGESEYYMYATVKRKNQEEYHTAGLVCYLPSEPTVITQGITYKENSSFAPVNNSAFRAWNSPSPIQLYLLAGDTVRLTGNIDYPAIASERYTYWIFPLTY